MSLKDYSVKPYSKKECAPWIEQKHYSRRMSIFWNGFALVSADGSVEGVVVYGQPSPPIQKHAFKDRTFRMYELTRLVVQCKEPNAASYLISNSLKMLSVPCAVVSYADEAHGHAGIVYQATNWLYTGATVSHDHLYLVEGVKTHAMTLRDRGITNPKEWARQNNITTIKPDKKHRYFKLVGNRTEVKAMRKLLSYPVVVPYPKLDKVMYDDGPEIVVHYDPLLAS